MRLDAGANGRELAEAGVIDDVAAPLEDRAGLHIDEVVVRIHRARDELLAETANRIDGGAPTASGDRVRGEEDAGDLCGDHPLHDDGESERAPIDRVRGPIRHGAVIPERRPAPAHRVQERGLAIDIEDRVLLAGEARLRKILRGRGRAHRDTPAQRAIRITHRGRDLGGNSRLQQPRARSDRVHRIDARSARGRGVRVRRDHEAVGNGKAGVDELAETRAFPAGDGEVLRAEHG